MKFKPEYLPEKARILLIRLKSIGDVTLNTAVFPLIKENFSECKLDYLVMTPCDQVILHNPNVDKVLKFTKTPGLKGLVQWFNLIKIIRKANYHMVIDMHGGPRSAIFAGFSGAKYKVGLARSRRARSPRRGRPSSPAS